MKIHILGSAAGGGFPQWNCNCHNCAEVRRGNPSMQPRTQSSIAVSGDGERWILINASPDIGAQLAAFPAAQPAGDSVRGTGIHAVMLVDSQIDHTAGLLTLREHGRLRLYTTRSVHEDLTTGFPVIPMLEHYCGVDWREVAADDDAFQVDGVPELAFTAVPLTGKAPPYSPGRHAPRTGDNIGVLIHERSSGRQAFYAPGLGALDAGLIRRMADVDCLMVDGTFWREDEMLTTGTGSKHAADMGHLPLSGPDGLIAVLQRLPRPQKYLVHINNTNPVLDERSPEAEMLRRAGITAARDGMSLDV
ncbi:pyrroloquinoline quinone biosynthesis protein PqqB [Arhodomonas sp. AD133]|uniref:pyrroloquinoline quinone biosynthesis protein PqqB n=1 Tax=Arhodomonas sp. AD133 TaxID=3415009 RepID=UPI003EBD1C3F